MERKALVLELEELAMRFSEGWHEGIKIDALDIVLLNEAAEALAQPAQELAIPSTQDAASKVGPFWQEFSVVYEAIGKQQITIREIAWRCFLAAKMTTQPALERNFCSRCGKRTWDIHTCTAPQENT